MDQESTVGELVRMWPPLTIIGVLGTSYSGTTLLGLMLGSHSKIAMAGELSSFKTARCTVCQQRKCPVWGRAFLDSLVQGPGFHRRVAERLGIDCIVDTSKAPPPCPWWDETFDQQAQYVWVHISKSPERLVASYRLREEGARRPLEDALAIWIETNRGGETYAEAMRSSHDARYVQVRYEDLVLFPEIELRRILKHCGFTYEEGQERFWEYDHHQLGGNTGVLSNCRVDLPCDSGYINPGEPENIALYTEQHRKIFLDVKWRFHLTMSDLDTIWANDAVKEIAQQWGYLPGGKLEPRPYWPKRPEVRSA